MALFDRIKFLANKQGKSVNDVESELGYSKNTLYRLKKTNPSAKKLEEIADYFHVSTDYLLGRTDNTSLDSNNDLEVEEALNSMRSYQGKPVSDSEREVLRGIIKAYLDSQDKDE
ncbi:helix-turn-helix transcriptional regulator [Lactiplantibacillus plantarum]|uniref:helix-turn-helix domain-containing protein n=1 Tax=Lactiplantibacillus plantarum TaxID=1590 RepID=UPI001C677B72|nr:helix-turn-helix transcriptional regulator [Lactiplantibacillus plantarum]QYC98880.1 helix-turn-helix transcriptional regulator [Lactiplantibacillus plantarum]WDQ20898.1 helix-turn-helix transcriptional regulator [Lactiplantibacillus plantarum]